MRALTFDLDGTLARVALRRLGLLPALARWHREMHAWNKVFREARRLRDPRLAESIRAEVGRRTGRSGEEIAAILEDVLDRRWPVLFRGATVPSAVRRLLDACDRYGLPRVVVSDHPALDKLDSMGLGGWSAAVDCGALGALKPHPDGLLAAAAMLGLPPAALVHVGDRWDTDGLMAARAGARFLHISRIERDNPFGAGPAGLPGSLLQGP